MRGYVKYLSVSFFGFLQLCMYRLMEQTKFTVYCDIIYTIYQGIMYRIPDEQHTWNVDWHPVGTTNLCRK